MQQRSAPDPFRGGLTWEQMEENNHTALREGMALTPGQRIESAIRVSRLATELAAAFHRGGDGDRDTAAGR